MCLQDLEDLKISEDGDLESELDDSCPSVGLTRIKQLSRDGGAHDVTKTARRSLSTPDFRSYFDNITSFS